MILRIASDAEGYDPKLGIAWCRENLIDAYTTGDTYVDTDTRMITYFKVLEESDLVDINVSALLIRCYAPLRTMPPESITEGSRS